MSTVSFDQRGYLGLSKSIRAAEAEEEGLLPLTRCAKATGVSAAKIKAYIDPAEWHHTGKYANATDYYDTAEVKRRFGPGGDLEQAKAPASPKSECIQVLAKEVVWIEWIGTAKHPRKVKRSANDVVCTLSGGWTRFTLPDGTKVRKAHHNVTIIEEDCGGR